MSASNRRQPTRSVRTSITRPSNYYARPYSFAGAPTTATDNDAAEDTAPGFFPAITHFTDAVTALPKEVMRHFTLLSETEGKAYAPGQAIEQEVATIRKLPPPPKHHLSSHTQAFVGFSLNNSINGSTNGSMIDGQFPQSRPASAGPLPMQLPSDPYGELRRSSYYRLGEKLKEMIGILDEKNMVVATANATLSKQLARMDETLPYVEQEISEEARLGSNNHWALPHMKEQRKAVGTSNERSRREIQSANNLAAAAAVVGEHDLTSARTETRREILQAKRKAQNVDSDFDDRPGSRKAQTSTKVRKVQDIGAVGDPKGSVPGPASTHVNKRRRIDKPIAPAMERSNSGMTSGKTALIKEAGIISREQATADVIRKKPKALALAAATRKRSGSTLPSPFSNADFISLRNAVSSPSQVLSPSRGTFPTASAPSAAIANPASARDQSPAANNQKVAAARARQNSAQSIKSVQERARNAPVAMPNGKSSSIVKASTPDLKTAAEVTGRSLGEARAGLTDVYKNSYGEQTIEEEGMAGALVVNPLSNNPGRPSEVFKREEAEPSVTDEPAATQSQPAQIVDSAPQSVPMAVTRSRNGITKPSKSATPVNAAWSEPPTMSRSRSMRGAVAGHSSGAAPVSSPTLGAVGSPRRSHKRGANTHGHSLASPSRSSASSAEGPLAGASGSGPGILPPIARIPHVPATSKPSRRSPRSRSLSSAHSSAEADGDGDDGGPDGPSSPASDEPRYCVCGGVSYGDMIACDNEACPREWFHLQCVGLTKAPGSKAKWYCDECKEVLRRGGKAVV